MNDQPNTTPPQMKLRIKNMVAEGNGGAGVYLSGPIEASISGVVLKDNKGGGVVTDSGEKQGEDDSDDRWHKKPVGVVTLSVVAAVTAATILGLLRHFKVWPF